MKRQVNTYAKTTIKIYFNRLKLCRKQSQDDNQNEKLFLVNQIKTFWRHRIIITSDFRDKLDVQQELIKADRQEKFY